MPCAALGACWIFQLRMMRAFGFGEGYTIALTLLAFFSYVLIHQVLVSIVWKVAANETMVEIEDVGYAVVEKQYPQDFFTTNQVHCLRSKYVHKDSRAPQFFAPGELVHKPTT